MFTNVAIEKYLSSCHGHFINCINLVVYITSTFILMYSTGEMFVGLVLTSSIEKKNTSRRVISFMRTYWKKFNFMKTIYRILIQWS